MVCMTIFSSLAQTAPTPKILLPQTALTALLSRSDAGVKPAFNFSSKTDGLQFVCGTARTFGGGGGGFTGPIPGDGGSDQLRGVPVIGRLPTDGTRDPEVIGYGRIWPDADGPVQGSLARDVKGPVIQNHSCCLKESRLNQPCGDTS